MPLTNNIDGTMQALKTGKGAVEVKDSDNNGNYDVVIVENYRGFLLGSVNSEKQIIYNKMYSGDNIDVGSKDYVYIKRGNAEINFNELETNTYLDIAESVNKNAIKIIVSETVLEGEKVFDASRQDTPANFIDNGANSLLYQIYRTYAQNTGYYAYTQLSFGFVSKVFDNCVVSWGINCDGLERERAVAANRKIAIYDAKAEKISVGDYSQIKDYVTAKDGCSRIFYHTSKGAYKGIFVYNK